MFGWMSHTHTGGVRLYSHTHIYSIYHLSFPFRSTTLIGFIVTVILNSTGLIYTPTQTLLTLHVVTPVYNKIKATVFYGCRFVSNGKLNMFWVPSPHNFIIIHHGMSDIFGNFEVYKNIR